MRLSGLPWDQANPELVVASARKPSRASRQALPRSHGLGITKQPDSWSRLNARHRSLESVTAVSSHYRPGQICLACVALISLPAPTVYPPVIGFRRSDAHRLRVFSATFFFYSGGRGE